MSQKSYAGAIKNIGSQVVKAPFATEGKKGSTVKTTGNDLRNGKGKSARKHVKEIHHGKRN